MASEDPPAETSSDTLIPVQENLSFQSFLRKRKDTMKFNWATYWFKLQNTTLYFYTNKEQQETSLRGQYYMFSVQSVRSLSDTDGDFTFEIVMKNGKRKLLSAESAELRDVWVRLLWKSMQLPGPGRYKSSCTWYDIPQLIKKFSFSADKPVVVADDNKVEDDGRPVVVADDDKVKDDGRPVVVADDNKVEDDGRPVVVADDNKVKDDGRPVVVADDVSEQPPGAVQTDGIDDGRPEAANVLQQFLCSVQPLYTGENSDQSSDDDDIYDVPRPQAMKLTVYSEHPAEEEEQQRPAEEEEQQRPAEEEEQQRPAEEEQQRTTKEQQRPVGEEEQRTALSHLQLCDPPPSDAADTDVSGVVLKASTEVPDISSSACVPESPAEESSPD